MKSKMHILLFVFGFVSLGISVFQFVGGRTLEAILSIVYFSMFFAGGVVYRSKNKKEQ